MNLESSAKKYDAISRSIRDKKCYTSIYLCLYYIWYDGNICGKWYLYCYLFVQSDVDATSHHKWIQLWRCLSSCHLEIIVSFRWGKIIEFSVALTHNHIIPVNPKMWKTDLWSIYISVKNWVTVNKYFQKCWM